MLNFVPLVIVLLLNSSSVPFSRGVMRFITLRQVVLFFNPPAAFILSLMSYDLECLPLLTCVTLNRMRFHAFGIDSKLAACLYALTLEYSMTFSIFSFQSPPASYSQDVALLLVCEVESNQLAVCCKVSEKVFPLASTLTVDPDSLAARWLAVR